MCSPSSQDAAVSPTIGTILLVALTVVLVAVVAVVALGLANGMFDTKQVGLTLEPYGIASESERGVSLTVHGGADAGDLIALSASLDGPELVSRETGKSSVENPVIGTGYRFKVEETKEEKISYRKDKNGAYTLAVTLTTTEIKPVPKAGHFVTVTGKFRDGTDQMLLVQRVTLPAISGNGVVTDLKKGVSVIPENITKIEPSPFASHGFVISPPEGLNLDWTTVMFKVFDQDGKQKILTYTNGLTPGKDENGKDDGSFDVNSAKLTAIDISTPYPDLTTYWSMGELTGTVTVKTIGNNPEIITIDKVVVPPRVNYLEGGDKYKGQITASDSKLTLQSTGSTSFTSTAPTTYYSLKSNPEKKIENIPDGASDEDILEAYVRLETGETHVWCKVASVKVGDL